MVRNGLELGLGLTSGWQAQSPAAPQRPMRMALYGDSFAQRGQDITGSPNVLDAGNVDPQTLRWASETTDRVGGVTWGFGPWIEMLSGGRYRLPWQLNHGIGGFNTGQLSRLSGADPTPWYLADFLARLTALPAALAPDAVILQAGTNDGVTMFTAPQSYAHVLKICQPIVARGLPVIVSTVLPRGNAANPTSRLTADRIAWADAFNALLVANLAAEPTLAGLVRVIDPRAAFRDTAGGAQAFDIAPECEYDGLHLSARRGVRLLAAAYLAALDAQFSTLQPTGLPMVGGPASFNANPFVTGTGGSLARLGNAATNSGFTLNGGTVSPVAGVVADGWTVTTTLNGGASAWNGTHPNNVKGDLAVAMVGSGETRAIRLTFDCDAAGLTNANTRAVEASCAVTLPATGVLAVGDPFQGLAVVEIARRAGLPIRGLRGVGAELRLTEPDGLTRVARSSGVAPNGTARLDWEDLEFTGSARLVLCTPPRLRKAGTYGAITFSVLIFVAGQAADIDAVVSISRAGVMRAG